jgi:small multidrug resistance pump
MDRKRRMTAGQQIYEWLAAHGWWLLAGAILFEIAGTTCMKLSDGFTKLLPSVLLIVLYLIAFSALTLCLKTIDMGIAYAIWAGVGTALAAVIGFVYFREPASLLKIVCIGLILVGVVGLHYGEMQEPGAGHSNDAGTSPVPVSNADPRDPTDT